MSEFLQALRHGDFDAWATFVFIVAVLGIGVVIPVLAAFP